jgi:GAF domain-containing protein
MEPLKTDMHIERGAAPGAGFEETQPEVRRAQPADSEDAAALREISLVFEESEGPSDAFALFASRLQSFIPFDCAVLGLRLDESLAPHFVFADGFDAFSKRPAPSGMGLSGWVAENGRPIVNGNPTVEPNYLVESGLLTAASSALAVPIFASNGSVFGVLSLYAAASKAFSKEDLRFLQGVESRFAHEMRNAFGFKATRESAGHTPPAGPGNPSHLPGDTLDDDSEARRFPPARETLAAL